jgi:WD40 repeat protein
VGVGPPQVIGSGPVTTQALSASRDGRVVAVARGVGARIFHTDGSAPLLDVGPHLDARLVAVSPSGRWVATGSHNSEGVRVWDATTGRLVKELPVGGSCHVVFSPDGHWLATTGSGQGRLWAAGSWEPGPAFGEVFWYACCFSPDSRFLAAETGEGVIRLVEVATGDTVARLTAPDQDRASSHAGHIMAFSPDGTRLVFAGRDTRSVHVWDLRALREGLARLGPGFDWEALPYPAPPETVPLRSVGVDLGKQDPAVKFATPRPAR